MKSLGHLLKIIGIIFGSIIILVIIGFITLMLYFNHVAPLENRPLGECTSPDCKHVCVVFVSNGGATTPYTVVAQVRGSWIIGKRTVYAVDNIEEATFRWIDNRTVRINGIDLDIYKDYYGGDIYDLEPK